MLPDQGLYFNDIGDEYFVRIKHSKRSQFECPNSYLGIHDADIAQCVAGADFVDASLVSFGEAPIISVKLYGAANFDRWGCYFWRVQIASGPCAGYYLDQNHGLNGEAQETHITRWSKEPLGSDLQFSNRPGTPEFNNAWNNEIIQGNTNFATFGFTPYYYMPYYHKGWFQIPRLYGYIGASEQDALNGAIASESQYCNCIDGNCNQIPQIGFYVDPADW